MRVREAAMVAVTVAVGCDLLPGTDAYYEKRAKETAAQLLIDPSSAQFRNVGARTGIVCGEINGKNRMNAYVGFSRFYVDTEKWQAALDPMFELSDLYSAQRICSTIYSCDQQVEQEAKQLDQIAFNAVWDAKCRTGAAIDRAVSMPYDPTGGNSLLPEENWIEDQPRDADPEIVDDEPSMTDDVDDDLTSAVKNATELNSSDPVNSLVDED